MSVTERDFFENDFVKFWIEDDILVCQYKETDNIDLRSAKTIVVERKRMTKGKSFSCLVNFSEVVNFSKEARSFFAEEESAEGLQRAAFVVPKAVQRVIASFFLLINKPEVPTRLFTDEESARTWLNSFK